MNLLKFAFVGILMLSNAPVWAAKKRASSCMAAKQSIPQLVEVQLPESLKLRKRVRDAENFPDEFLAYTDNAMTTEDVIAAWKLMKLTTNANLKDKTYDVDIFGGKDQQRFGLPHRPKLRTWIYDWDVSTHTSSPDIWIVVPTENVEPDIAKFRTTLHLAIGVSAYSEYMWNRGGGIAFGPSIGEGRIIPENPIEQKLEEYRTAAGNAAMNIEYSLQWQCANTYALAAASVSTRGIVDVQKNIFTLMGKMNLSKSSKLLQNSLTTKDSKQTGREVEALIVALQAMHEATQEVQAKYSDSVVPRLDKAVEDDIVVQISNANLTVKQENAIIKKIDNAISAIEEWESSGQPIKDLDTILAKKLKDRLP